MGKDGVKVVRDLGFRESKHGLSRDLSHLLNCLLGVDERVPFQCNDDVLWGGHNGHMSACFGQPSAKRVVAAVRAAR